MNITIEELRAAVADHVDNEYGDESFNAETSEVTYYNHECRSYCADDIWKRIEQEKEETS
jgi:hypothetical protein